MLSTVKWSVSQWITWWLLEMISHLKIKHIRPLVHNHVPTLKMKRHDRPSIGLKVLFFSMFIAVNTNKRFNGSLFIIHLPILWCCFTWLFSLSRLKGQRWSHKFHHGPCRKKCTGGQLRHWWSCGRNFPHSLGSK